MTTMRRIVVWVVGGLLLSGCAAPTVDVSKLERPERADELQAYDVFVGSWDWQAQMLNAADPDKKWSGQAEWKWTLDKRCLHGTMSAKSANAAFEAAGVWSWHPKKKQYIWWMFNNWGYPQQGTATYEAASKCWTMPYQSVGLDGTPSFGVYEMKAANNDTLEWRMDEWTMPWQMGIKKMEMTGTYKRRR